MKKSSARNPREDAVVRGDDRMEGAGVVAGGFLGGGRMALVELDFPAARAEALAYGRAGKARTDHRGFLYGMFNRRISALAAGDQHLLLVAEALALLNRETGGFKRRAHRSGDAPRRRRRARRGEARERAHHLRRPHVGILRRCEAVEIERVRR